MNPILKAQLPITVGKNIVYNAIEVVTVYLSSNRYTTFLSWIKENTCAVKTYCASCQYELWREQEPLNHSSFTVIVEFEKLFVLAFRITCD